MNILGDYLLNDISDKLWDFCFSGKDDDLRANLNIEMDNQIQNKLQIYLSNFLKSPLLNNFYTEITVLIRSDMKQP